MLVPGLGRLTGERQQASLVPGLPPQVVGVPTLATARRDAPRGRCGATAAVETRAAAHSADCRPIPAGRGPRGRADEVGGAPRPRAAGGRRRAAGAAGAARGGAGARAARFLALRAQPVGSRAAADAQGRGAAALGRQILRKASTSARARRRARAPARRSRSTRSSRRRATRSRARCCSRRASSPTASRWRRRRRRCAASSTCRSRPSAASGSA